MTREEFAQLADAKYNEIQALNDEPTLLDYERGFLELWTELGGTVAQANLGDQGGDRRKKKSSPPPSAP